MADWQSGLDDDDASTGRNVVAPLDALGIDPDEALTNRAAVMARLNQVQGSSPQRMQAVQQAMQRPPAPPLQPAAPSSSTIEAATVGGAGSSPAPAPAPAAAPTAAAVSPTGGTGTNSTPTPGQTLEDYGTAGLSGLEKNMNLASQSAAAEPTEDPEDATLEAKRVQDMAAHPEAYDPTTGKLKPQYAPSGWQRVGRGLEGAALGLAGGGLPGAIVGAIKPGATGSTNYGAPTAQYGRDVAQNEQTVASDDQQIQAAKDRFAAYQKAKQTQASDYRAAAGLGKDLTTGATGMENAATDAQTKPVEANARLQEANNNDPNAKLTLSASQFAQRQRQADRLGLRGTTRSVYILNGKVPDPRQATAEEIATGQAEKIFRQQHGRGPQTIEEFGQIQQAARGQQDRANTNTADAANARALLRSTEGHLKALQALKAKTFDADELKNLNGQIQQAQTEYDNAQQRVASTGNSPTVAPALSTGSPKKSPPTIGSTILVDGKSMKVVGINPKTNKAIVAPL